MASSRRDAIGPRIRYACMTSLAPPALSHGAAGRQCLSCVKPNHPRPVMTSSTVSLPARPGLDRNDARRHLARGLEGADDGELFLEYRQSEMLLFDNGRLKQATYDTAQGFGLRAVKDEAVGYAHASDMSEAAIQRAAEAVRAVQGGYFRNHFQPPRRRKVRAYCGEKPP